MEFPPAASPAVLTAQEVADLIRVSRATILRLHRRGDLPALPLRGRLLFSAQAIAEFIARPRKRGARE